MTCDKPERVWSNPNDPDSERSVWKPTDLQIEQISVTQIKLNWNDNADGEDGFKIDRKIDGGDWEIGIGLTDENISEWIDEISIPVGIYYYRVYAHSNENISSIIHDTISIDFKPANLQIERLSKTEIKLNWNIEIEGEDGFKIDRKIGEDAWEISYGVTDENVTEWIDENVLNPYVRYHYRAYATWSDYESNYLENYSPTYYEIIYLNNGSLNIMESNGANPRALYNGTVREFSISTDGSKITFELDNTEPDDRQIGVINVDGTGFQVLTSHQSTGGGDGFTITYDASSPLFSPDGSQIVYFLRAMLSSGSNYIMKVDLNGNSSLVHKYGNGAPHFSSDGNVIYFIWGYMEDRAIYKVNSNGGTATKITSNWGFYNYISLSNDGEKILGLGSVNSTSTLYLMGLNGEGLTTIAQLNAIYNPAFSFNDEKIVFDTLNEIYIMNVNGSNQTNISNSPNTQDMCPYFSPDNSKVVFTRDNDIYMMDIDGSNQIRLMNCEENWWNRAQFVPKS